MLQVLTLGGGGGVTTSIPRMQHQIGSDGGLEMKEPTKVKFDCGFILLLSIEKTCEKTNPISWIVQNQPF